MFSSIQHDPPSAVKMFCSSHYGHKGDRWASMFGRGEWREEIDDGVLFFDSVCDTFELIETNNVSAKDILRIHDKHDHVLFRPK